ncbi:MAG: hypothetical protein U9N37_02890 [Thermodesulfobacteriota bacterium]|nr:hypothetical protein [Thermodesulfobacteriota bacterium]
MNVLSLIIAIVALLIAILAYLRSGGVKDMRKTTATLLAKMEQAVRKDEEKGKEK